MKQILGLLLVVGFFFYLNSERERRESIIDYLNIRFGGQDWARLTTAELKQVYEVVRLIQLDVNPSAEKTAKIEPILLKYNIKFVK